MGPWIMFLFFNVALLYFAYLALFKPQVVLGWLGSRIRNRLDRHFRYRAIVRVVGVAALVGLAAMNWLLIQWA